MTGEESLAASDGLVVAVDGLPPAAAAVAVLAPVNAEVGLAAPEAPAAAAVPVVLLVFVFMGDTLLVV